MRAGELASISIAGVLLAALPIEPQLISADASERSSPDALGGFSPLCNSRQRHHLSSLRNRSGMR